DPVKRTKLVTGLASIDPEGAKNFELMTRPHDETGVKPVVLTNHLTGEVRGVEPKTGKTLWTQRMGPETTAGQKKPVSQDFLTGTVLMTNLNNELESLVKKNPNADVFTAGASFYRGVQGIPYAGHALQGLMEPKAQAAMDPEQQQFDATKHAWAERALS